MDKEPTPTADEAAVKNLMDAIVKDFNEGDLETLFSLHPEEVILMNADVPLVEGEANIGYLFDYFRREQITMRMQYTYHKIEVRGPRASIRGQLCSTVAKAGRPPVNDTGTFHFLFNKQPDGAWLRTHVMVNREVPVKA